MEKSKTITQKLQRLIASPNANTRTADTSLVTVNGPQYHEQDDGLLHRLDNEYVLTLLNHSLSPS